MTKKVKNEKETQINLNSEVIEIAKNIKMLEVKNA